jgi:hypothetical protein
MGPAAVGSTVADRNKNHAFCFDGDGRDGSWKVAFLTGSMDGPRRVPLRPWRRKAKITLFAFLMIVVARMPDRSFK